MIRVLDSAGSTLVEWGRQQQQHDYYDVDIVFDDENDNGDDDDINDNYDINKFTMPRSPIKCFRLCSSMMYVDGNYVYECHIPEKH